MCGTNNVVNDHCSINYSDLQLTLSKTLNTNMILVVFPPIHDKPSLNPTVASVNEKLRILSSKCKHVIFLQFD